MNNPRLIMFVTPTSPLVLSFSGTRKKITPSLFDSFMCLIFFSGVYFTKVCRSTRKSLKNLPGIRITLTS